MIALFEPEFGISISYTPSTATVAVTGELDLATAPKLARALEQLPEEVVEIDLRLGTVWFADATAIARLLRSQRRLLVQGRTVIVGDVSDDVLHTMRVTGLLPEFTLREPPAPRALL